MISFDTFSKFIISMAYAIPRFAPDFKDPIAIKVWYDEFKDFEYSDLQQVFAKAKTSFDVFPSMKQMHDLLNPDAMSKDLMSAEAKDAASRAIESVRKHGWTEAKEAKEYIGSLGWLAVERLGGWDWFCEILNKNNTPQIQAQMRDVCHAQLIRQSFGIKADKAPQIENIDQQSKTAKLIEGLCENKMDLINEPKIDGKKIVEDFRAKYAEELYAIRLKNKDKER